MNHSKNLIRLVATLIVLAMTASACSNNADYGGQRDIMDAQGIEAGEPKPDDTPIAPNDDVRIGTLDNGMTYYVQSNPNPTNGLSLRLVVNAGSTQQTEAESGAAHFLEHMLFNGTKKYPGNELDSVLENLGVQIGADSNAYTSSDETVYQLDIPDAEKDVDQVLDVMHQWMTAATITEKDTVDERGVIREEARIYLDGAGAQLDEAMFEAMNSGTDYENSDPLGTVENINETTADGLRTFYDRWYRPDNMAIVAVGDLPVDELEAKITEQFSSATSRGDNQERSTATADISDTPIVKVVADPTLATARGTLTYPITTWDNGTVGGERLSTIQQLYGTMIWNRLLAVADEDDAIIKKPFAYAAPFNRQQTGFQIGFESSELAKASARVHQELSGFVSSGFTEADLEQAVAELQAALDQELAESETKDNIAFSDSYTQHFLAGWEISSTEDRHARVSAVLESLTAEDVTDVFRWDMYNSTHQLIVGGPDADKLPAEDDLAFAFSQGLAVDANAVDDGSVAIKELMTPPAPVEPTETGSLEGFDGGTQMVFANGLTVNVVPSKTEAGQVALLATAPGGYSALEPSDGALLNEALQAVGTSGVGDIDRLDYQQFLYRTTTQLFPVATDTMHGFNGVTGSDDLEILMQNLHLAVASPRVDEASLTETKESAKESLSAVGLDTEYAVNNGLTNILYRDDERFDYVPSENLDELTSDKAMEIYTTLFGGVDGWTINIVGDVDDEQVVELASRYLGTLPAGTPVESADVRPDVLTDVERRTVNITGSDDAGGAAGLAYEVALPIDDKTRVELMVISAILNNRLTDSAREDLGATYGGNVFAEGAGDPIDRATVVFTSTGDPERVDQILKLMVEAADSLAVDGPKADEVSQTKAVLEADFEADISNEELVAMMPTGSEAGITPERRSEVLAEVEADDIAELAEKLFAQGGRAELLVLPK